MFNWYSYKPLVIVGTEVRHWSATVEVCFQAVKTLLLNIHALCAKWNVAWTTRNVSTVFYLLKPLQAGSSLENVTPKFTFTKEGSYHHTRISLIVLHTFGKYLVALSSSASQASPNIYCICIRLVAVIVLYPHKNLQCTLPDLYLSLCVEFGPYRNHAFSLVTDTATSCQGSRSRARKHIWDITAEHACSCLCEEFEDSVDESGSWDNAKQVYSKLSSSQDDVAGSR